MDFEYWQGFNEGRWQQIIDVRNFIQANYKPYDGNADFLAGITDKTKRVWDKCLDLLALEHEKGGCLLYTSTNTIDVMDIMTEIRHRWGMYYDSEKIF